jgi:hypothetical protein
MAKFSRSLAVSRPIIVQMPRRAGRLRRAGSRAVRVIRRGGSAARRSLPTVGIALGGAVVGYLQGSGRLDFLPEVGGSRMVTLGLAGYAATRFVRNPHVRAAGLACLAASAFDFGRVQGGGTHGDWGWTDA